MKKLKLFFSVFALSLSLLLFSREVNAQNSATKSTEILQIEQINKVDSKTVEVRFSNQQVMLLDFLRGKYLSDVSG